MVFNIGFGFGFGYNDFAAYSMGRTAGYALGMSLFKPKTPCGFGLFGGGMFGSYTPASFGAAALASIYDSTPNGARALTNYSLNNTFSDFYTTGIVNPRMNTLGIASPSSYSAGTSFYGLGGGSALGGVNIGSHLQNYQSALSSTSFSLGTNLGIGNVPISTIGGGIGIGTSVGTGTVQDKDAQKYQAKMNLLQKYAALKEKSLNTEIQELLKDIPMTDYKARCEKLDAYMKTLDASLLKRAAKDIQKANFEAKQKAGKTISDAWTKTLAEGTGTTVNTSALTKDNVLSAIGTHFTNEKFSALGKSNMWDAMIKNDDNFEMISLKLYNKAEDMAEKYSDKKSEIETAVNALKSAAKNDRPTACYNLFDCLRRIEAQNTDSDETGLPADMADGSNIAIDNYNKEKEAYNNAPSMRPTEG